MLAYCEFEIKVQSSVKHYTIKIVLLPTADGAARDLFTLVHSLQSKHTQTQWKGEPYSKKLLQCVYKLAVICGAQKEALQAVISHSMFKIATWMQQLQVDGNRPGVLVQNMS